MDGHHHDYHDHEDHHHHHNNNTHHPNYSICRMSPEDVDAAFDLVEAEGHSITRERFTLVYRAFPEAFYVAVDEAGTVTGSASFIQTMEGIFSVGYVVTCPSARKHGLKRKLISDTTDKFLYTALLATALPGTDPLYINLGFDLIDSQEDHIIFEMAVDKNAVDSRIASTEASTDVTIRLFSDTDLESLTQYDNTARGLDNTRYTAVMVECNQVLLALNSNGGIVGYVSGFICRRQVVLDGLYADSDSIALRLFKSIVDQFPEADRLKFQTPKSRTLLSTLGQITLCKEAKKYAFEGKIPSTSSQKTYCVTDSNFTC